MVAVQWDFGLFLVLFIFQLIHLELPCTFATHVYVDLVCSPGLLFYILLYNFISSCKIYNLITFSFLLFLSLVFNFANAIGIMHVFRFLCIFFMHIIANLFYFNSLCTSILYHKFDYSE